MIIIFSTQMHSNLNYMRQIECQQLVSGRVHRFAFINLFVLGVKKNLKSKSKITFLDNFLHFFFAIFGPFSQCCSAFRREIFYAPETIRETRQNADETIPHFCSSK